MSIDFLIVGGGIGGAVLANLLGRRGKRVLVLEKSRATLPHARPEILWPATVQTLRTLLPPSLEKLWVVPIRGFIFACGRRTLLHVTPAVLDKAGVQPYSSDHTRELLMQQAACDYQRGIEVTQVLRDKGRVIGVRARDASTGREQDILAEWTVGDDGSHSLIRRESGLAMMIVRFPAVLLGFRFDWPSSMPADTGRFWLNEDRVRSGLLGMPAIPMPNGKGAALISLLPETFTNQRHLQSSLERFAAQDPLLSEVVGGRSWLDGMTHFHIGWARNPCFGTAGALLMGDAAHPVTPAGGQGANAAVADALAIAEAALECPGQLLEAYAQRRRAAVQRSLSLSRSSSRFFSLPRPLINLGLALAPWVARWLNNKPERFGPVLRRAANAFPDRPQEE